MPTTTMAILTPVYGYYKSLRVRVLSLAKERQFEADVIHVSTKDDLRLKLGEWRNSSASAHAQVCLYCDIADGKDSPDELQDYLAALWRDQDPWLRARPLTITSEFDPILRELRKVQLAHGRAHSFIMQKLATVGVNRFEDIRDVLLEGLVNA